MSTTLETPLEVSLVANLPLAYTPREYPDTQNEAVRYTGFGGEIGFSPVAIETDRFIIAEPQVVLGVDRMTPQTMSAATAEFQPISRLSYWHFDAGLDDRIALKLNDQASVGFTGGIFGSWAVDRSPNPNAELDRYGNVAYDPNNPKKSLIDQGGVPVSNNHENVLLEDKLGWGFRVGGDGHFALLTSEKSPDLSLILGAHYSRRNLKSNNGDFTPDNITIHAGFSIAP